MTPLFVSKDSKWSFTMLLMAWFVYVRIITRYYRVPHETWQLVNSLKFFFHILKSCLIIKRLKTFFIWQLYYGKIDFTVKYIYIYELNVNCKKSLTSNRVCMKKTFSSIHKLSCFVGHPVYDKELLPLYVIWHYILLRLGSMFTVCSVHCTLLYIVQ